MANLDEFLKKLQKMDQKELSSLIQRAAAGLSPEQKEQLQKLTGDPQKLQHLQNSITAADLEKLSKNVSPETLQNLTKGINGNR